MVWWKKDRQAEELETSAPNSPHNLPAVASRPDLAAPMPEDPAGGHDFCYCGEVELVYGGNVKVQSDETNVMTLHRKDHMCEDFRLGIDSETLTYRYLPGKSPRDRRKGASDDR